MKKFQETDSRIRKSPRKIHLHFGDNEDRIDAVNIVSKKLNTDFERKKKKREIFWLNFSQIPRKKIMIITKYITSFF